MIWWKAQLPSGLQLGSESTAMLQIKQESDQGALAAFSLAAPTQLLDIDLTGGVQQSCAERREWCPGKRNGRRGVAAAAFSEHGRMQDF